MKILEHAQIGKMKLRNRIYMAPMARQRILMDHFPTVLSVTMKNGQKAALTYYYRRQPGNHQI